MEDYSMRFLEKSDYQKGYLDLLGQLTLINYFGEEKFNEIFEKINGSGNIEIYVIEKDNKIIASATIIYEQKFIRNGGIVAHLEDVVVHKEFRGINLGQKLIENIVKIAKLKNAYKIILDCNEKLINFYGKNGFEKKEIQMVIYF